MATTRSQFAGFNAAADLNKTAKVKPLPSHRTMTRKSYRDLPPPGVRTIGRARTEDAEPSTVMGRARDFLSGRAGERREKKRNRAPRNMLGRRG